MSCTGYFAERVHQASVWRVSLLLSLIIGSLQADDRLWLVFRDEGLSLHSLMYSPRQDLKEGMSNHPVPLHVSPWWADLRNSSEVGLPLLPTG